MQCSAALGRVGKVGRVGRVGRVARVNAGRTAVATGDRGGLQCTHWSGFTASSRLLVLWVGFLSKYSGMSRVEVGV